MGDFFGNLRGNLESLGKTLSEKAEVVSKKTEDVVEITKMKNQIHTMGRNNERDLQDIGKMVYDQYKQGKEIAAEFVELCEAIADRENTMEELNKQVAELKGKEICENCKEHLDANVSYCPNCGTKVKREAETKEVVAEVEAEIVEEDVFEVEE